MLTFIRPPPVRATVARRGGMLMRPRFLANLPGPHRFLAMSLVICAGCGSGDTRTGPPLHKVSGVVKHNGQPLVGADVTFQLKDNSGSSFGRTDASGRYQLTTRTSGDGAPAGDYLVAIAKLDEATGSSAPVVSTDDPNYNPFAGKKSAAAPPPKSSLPAQYGDVKTSGLTARITEATSALDFDLK